MITRFAFVGLRHPHIFDMYGRCCERQDVDVVACCEGDQATRDALAGEGKVTVTHERFETVLQEVECDVVAVGDCYGRRAGIITAALDAGKHVISDKPICISLEELDEIEQAASANGRIVGCMLDMRDLAVYLGLRQQIQEGRIGQVHAISFDGQHPLLYGKRPSWYFEEGMHGGVLNDLIVHAVDFIPWATGLRIKTVAAARCWNATVPQHPDFMQCGQALMSLENGGGVVGDVSYLTPDSFAYAFPFYWRFTVWGADGALEAGVNSESISLFRNGQTEAEAIPLPPAKPGAYLDAFLREIRGETDALHVSSAEALSAARISLQIQQAADRALCHLAVNS